MAKEITQEELDEMGDNVNKSMEKVYEKNFPDFEPPKIKLKKEDEIIDKSSENETKTNERRER